MSTTEPTGIRIGALCDPIYKQLGQQGIKVTKSQVQHLQRAYDGLVALKVMGCMGDSEAERISQRLVNKIAKWVEQYKNNSQQ